MALAALWVRATRGHGCLCHLCADTTTSCAEAEKLEAFVACLLCCHQAASTAAHIRAFCQSVYARLRARRMVQAASVSAGATLLRPLSPGVAAAKSGLPIDQAQALLGLLEWVREGNLVIAPPTMLLALVRPGLALAQLACGRTLCVASCLHEIANDALVHVQAMPKEVLELSTMQLSPSAIPACIGRLGSVVRVHCLSL